MHLTQALLGILALSFAAALPQEPVETETTLLPSESSTVQSQTSQASIPPETFSTSTLPPSETNTLAPSTTSEAISEPTTGGETLRCSGRTARKEVRQMKQDGDWDAFIGAYMSLVSDGTLASYVNQHVQSWGFAHFNAHFLPYHRIFLKKFEEDLQSRGARYLPYWDSSADSQDLLNSQILTAEFFGKLASDGTIQDGPFSRGNYSTPVDGLPLTRGYKEGDTLYAFPLIQNAINNPSFSGMSEDIEYGQHAVVHSIIGGASGSMSVQTSPNDPLFFLHHCYVDYIFYKWQLQNPGSPFEADNYNLGRMTPNEIIAPWNVPVRNAWTVDQACVGYEDPDPNVVKVAGNGTIRPPSNATAWLNNAGANKTVAKTVAKKATENVKKVKED
ncbi:hypothetical protein HK099_003795 [Clydaea vesicula]|uniref:Tyrosinase copper-binding domain-containing protein n=1 Tax=Clydaea vesicula TaxID=447962 RepID=A0AAD5U175_9FUNG|nr:hypothetical protein HK099_003795 [Clydaea vesicula]